MHYVGLDWIGLDWVQTKTETCTELVMKVYQYMHNS